MKIFNQNIMAQLITSAQNFTSGWVDLGAEQDVTQYKNASLYLNVDINDSVDTRVRMVVKLAKNALNEYSQIDGVATAGVLATTQKYYEVAVDADQKIIIDFDVTGYSYVKFQIQAGTVGATAGQIDEADVIYTY